jgi:TonB family protein
LILSVKIALKSPETGLFSGFLLSPRPPVCQAKALTITTVSVTIMTRINIRKLLAAGVLGTLISLPTALHAIGPDFRMIGLAVHQETGREIYLGALHVDKMVPKPNDLVQASGPKVMEYRVVARRTSIRSLLGNILLQGELASGKSPSATTAEFAGIIISSIQGSLYAGDSLEFLLSADDQTIASLNGYELARIDDGYVFDYLLRGWVDERGPSTAFRAGILEDQLSPSLLEAYDAHTASPERLAVVSTWQQPEEPAPVAVEETPVAIDADETPVLVAEAEQLEPQTSATVALVDEVVAAADLPQPEPAITLPKLDTSAADIEDAAQKIALEPMQLAMASPVSAVGELEPAVRDINNIGSLDVMEYSQRLALFNSTVLRMLTVNIRYPKAAVRRSLQGSLELDLTLQEDGTLSGVVVGRSSGHNTLDEAAIRAANKAFKGGALESIDPVAAAEYGDNSGVLIVPVPVNFILTE